MHLLGTGIRRWRDWSESTCRNYVCEKDNGNTLGNSLADPVSYFLNFVQKDCSVGGAHWSFVPKARVWGVLEETC